MFITNNLTHQFLRIELCKINLALQLPASKIIKICVQYFKDGSKIVTGGVSGDIFVSSGIEDTIDDFEPFTTGDEVLGFSISEDG